MRLTYTGLVVAGTHVTFVIEVRAVDGVSANAVTRGASGGLFAGSVLAAYLSVPGRVVDEALVRLGIAESDIAIIAQTRTVEVAGAHTLTGFVAAKNGIGLGVRKHRSHLELVVVHSGMGPGNDANDHRKHIGHDDNRAVTPGWVMNASPRAWSGEGCPGAMG